jgi:hypothetical protein
LVQGRGIIKRERKEVRLLKEEVTASYMNMKEDKPGWYPTIRGLWYPEAFETKEEALAWGREEAAREDREEVVGSLKKEEWNLILAGLEKLVGDKTANQAKVKKLIEKLK